MLPFHKSARLRLSCYLTLISDRASALYTQVLMNCELLRQDLSRPVLLSISRQDTLWEIYVCQYLTFWPSKQQGQQLLPMQSAWWACSWWHSWWSSASPPAVIRHHSLRCQLWSQQCRNRYNPNLRVMIYIPINSFLDNNRWGFDRQIWLIESSY